MSDFRYTPDECLLRVAKIAWSRLEPDDRLEVWNEVIKRWEVCLQEKKVEQIVEKYYDSELWGIM